MATFNVPNSSIDLHVVWKPRQGQLLMSGEFRYYPDNLDPALVSDFARPDVVAELVPLATFNGLTGVQMVTAMKARITTKLEGLPGGPHTVNYV